MRVLIASLAPGGAERIVLEWLAAEAARGRVVDLAVLHARRNALDTPRGIEPRVRGREDPQSFVRELAQEWRAAPAPVSTHLVADPLLEILWDAGVRTVPVVHNSREGWRNDAKAWTCHNVPMAIACAAVVRQQLIEDGCRVPIVTLRHRPRVGAAAFDPDARREMRSELGIKPGTFLLAAVGAFKPQKDHARAVAVLAKLCKRRDAALVILGGLLDRAGQRELDRVMDAALALGVAENLRLPGFVPVIEPYLAACDALLNVSRFEGLSMAVQEALAAGLPVVAADVGGQGEIEHPALELLPADTAPHLFAERLARHPVRTALEAHPFKRAPRVWSLSTASRAATPAKRETLFVTANLNAGGAQRSLVNLARELGNRHRFAIAVCGETTHGGFARELRQAHAEVFRPAADADPIAVAESLLAHASGARNICFWNADARVKLLVAKFAPRELRIVDVSPGDYAFEEMQATAEFAATIAYSSEAFYQRLDVLVLKYPAAAFPACSRVEVIANGVAARASAAPAPSRPRFLVSGRIAPSKRLETLIDAFALVAARHADAELHVVGPVEERHAVYADALVARAHGLPVRFRGADFALGYFEEPFSAAVVLGTHQGSPNAVLEAMAAGIAVIANDSGGTRELVIDAETGWLVPEDPSPEALSRCMLEAIARPWEAHARAQRALERVRSRFTLAAMASRYLAVLGAEEPVPREKIGVDERPHDTRTHRRLPAHGWT
jgi:glycosyltransferase involved in cell wall biosynthesis